MNWSDKFLRSLRQLYRSFLIRDVFGYVLPGLLVLIVFLFNYKNQINTFIGNEMVCALKELPNAIIILFVFALSYVTGISMFGMGIALGLLRYYPVGVKRLYHHLQSVQFTSNSEIKKFSVARERLVILLHTSGNFSIALFLCSWICFKNGIRQNILYFLLFFGLAALARHWETVYNLRSFQKAVLDTHDIYPIFQGDQQKEKLGRFFEEGGVFGCVCALIKLWAGRGRN